MDMSPEILAAAIEISTERRRQAILQTLMLVVNSKLPAWSAFDYAFALDRFMATGLPPRDTIKPEPTRRRPVQ